MYKNVEARGLVTGHSGAGYYYNRDQLLLMIKRGVRSLVPEIQGKQFDRLRSSFQVKFTVSEFRCRKSKTLGKRVFNAELKQVNFEQWTVGIRESGCLDKSCD